MTVLLAESFNGAAVGVAPSAANTLFTSYGGTSTTRAFASSGGLFGQYVYMNPASIDPQYAQLILAGGIPTAYLRWYHYLASVGAGAQLVIAGALLGSTFRCQVAYGNGTGNIGIRQNQTLKKSTVGEYVAQWVRCEWDITSPSGVNGVQTLRVYAGANLHTTTPTETLTDATALGQFDRFRLGFVTNPGNTNAFSLDEVVIDDAAQPAPLADPSSPGGPAPYVWDGSAWVKKNTISVWDGSAWVDKTTITVY